MKVASFGRAAAILSVASLALVACGDDNGDGGNDAEENGSTTENGANGGGEGGEAGGDLAGAEDVSGDYYGGGASSHETAMLEWIFAFEEQSGGAAVEYASVGSGNGRSGFLSGEYQFAGSDAAMSSEEYEESTSQCGPDGAFHLPTYIAPIGVAVNVDGIDENLNLDADTLASIFSGEITSWDDEAIAEHNEGVDLPSTPITVVHRQDNSGTTENFTEYLEQASSNWEWEASGDWPSEITSESAEGTGGVIGLAADIDGAVTYADAGRIDDNFVMVNVEVGGEYTELSPEAAATAVGASDRVEGGAPNDMAFEIARDTEELGAYPIVQIAYTIWCNEYPSQEEADFAQAFAAYIVSEDAQNLASDLAGSAPISDELRDEALEAISQISAG
ncbi:phosphate ABC transporter substrate-binding protein PstS [Nesterenkonia flava]|uniref:Phosphate-binding protein n=1 Tax=Nesterenkonia flava TaxID=469799 RepID=A0ABU1FVN5_9MICC|nr:phosphate ABC transporter substrate-binding protein PstS [Nesterenkonia flava]MDR5712211.1 phosphate ABC transporter substrate-binding protein PstS [Nesterenkonia flava]